MSFCVHYPKTLLYLKELFGSPLAPAGVFDRRYGHGHIAHHAFNTISFAVAAAVLLICFYSFAFELLFYLCVCVLRFIALVSLSSNMPLCRWLGALLYRDFQLILCAQWSHQVLHGNLLFHLLRERSTCVAAVTVHWFHGPVCRFDSLCINKRHYAFDWFANGFSIMSQSIRDRNGMFAQKMVRFISTKGNRECVGVGDVWMALHCIDAQPNTIWKLIKTRDISGTWRLACASLRRKNWEEQKK